MWASSQLLDEEARKEAKDRADGSVTVGLSPAALKRRLAKKKAEQRKAKKL
jgi:hypothetical protein